MSNIVNKTPVAKIVFFWLLAGVPLSWGVYQTLTKVAVMFH